MVIKLLFNFVFFGFIFYLIYTFAPEAFTAMVSAMDSIYGTLKELVLKLMDQIQAKPEA